MLESCRDNLLAGGHLPEVNNRQSEAVDCLLVCVSSGSPQVWPIAYCLSLEALFILLLAFRAFHPGFYSQCKALR